MQKIKVLKIKDSDCFYFRSYYGIGSTNIYINGELLKDFQLYNGVSFSERDNVQYMSSRQVSHYERNGYKFVQLYRNKKSKNFNIHRLVAMSFLNNDLALSCVNHKDGNKHNNIVENLEWCTNEYNHMHATITGLKASKERVSSSKLTEEKAEFIREFLKIGISHEKLAEIFKVSRTTISLISNNKIWKLTGKELEINL